MTPLDVLGADLFSMLTQTFCPNIPNGLDRSSFCHSCTNDECFFHQACVQVPGCLRDAVARHISTRHLAGFPVGVHIHCLWGFQLPSSGTDRDPRKLQNVRDIT